MTQGRYSDSVGDAAFQYPSSGWLDDLAWGAAWLYAATGTVLSCLRHIFYWCCLPVKLNVQRQKQNATYMQRRPMPGQ